MALTVQSGQGGGFLDEPEIAASDRPLLQIEPSEDGCGCVVLFSGSATRAAAIAILSIEPMSINEGRVTLDISKVTSFDADGLRAVAAAMDSARAFGGTLNIR
jgi:anti-anti-sigma regulatory factor